MKALLCNLGLMILLIAPFILIPAAAIGLGLFLFGNKDEQFAAHLITKKPDFDQIFVGSVPGGVAKQLEEKRNIVGVSELENSPFVPENALSLTVGDKDVSFSKMTQIYLEENELK